MSVVQEVWFTDTFVFVIKCISDTQSNWFLIWSAVLSYKMFYCYFFSLFSPAIRCVQLLQAHVPILIGYMRNNWTYFIKRISFISIRMCDVQLMPQPFARSFFSYSIYFGVMGKQFNKNANFINLSYLFIVVMVAFAFGSQYYCCRFFCIPIWKANVYNIAINISVSIVVRCSCFLFFILSFFFLLFPSFFFRFHCKW